MVLVDQKPTTIPFWEPQEPLFDMDAPEHKNLSIPDRILEMGKHFRKYPSSVTVGWKVLSLQDGQYLAAICHDPGDPAGYGVTAQRHQVVELLVENIPEEIFGKHFEEYIAWWANLRHENAPKAA